MSILNRLTLKKIVIKTKAFFIKNRKLRNRWKKIITIRTINNLVLKYKWGVSYSVFDNEELLEHSIKSIRNHVNYINVVYQLKSWYGNPAQETLLPKLQQLKNQGLIDELIEYKSNPNIYAGTQEANKRNLGLEYAKRSGINYFMTMDCDEFYIQNEFKKAKYFIVKNGITHSFCDIFNYFSPTLRYLSPTPSYINFFSKINKYSKLSSHNNKTITLVDSTRQLNHSIGSKYYFLSNIAMHHMTYYRKDIKRKITNSTARDYYKSVPKPINCAKVPDIFNICNIFK